MITEQLIDPPELPVADDTNGDAMKQTAGTPKRLRHPKGDDRDRPEPAINAPGAESELTQAGPKPSASEDLKSLPLAEVQTRLGYASDGLTDAEAKKRLAQYGPNEIEEQKENPLLKLLSYFWGPIPLMIEVAVILSGLLRHWPDFFIILVLLVANTAVGFSEEHQAGKAIDALKAQLAIRARVRRDGKWVTPRRARWSPATSSACAWATSCPPTRAFSRVTRSRSTNRR